MDIYIDPILLDSITYIDEDGNRRVKNPYRNRHSYGLIVPAVNDEGNFVMTVQEDIVGKSVFVDFPGKVMYRFTVSAATNEVTIIGIPPHTYIEVNVVNPKPLPRSHSDLLWDRLDAEAQKSIMAAWGDIDLICNVLYPSTADSEFNFDQQNTLKFGLIGFRNNCGNLRNAGWGYKDIPRNGRYFPPQPIPTPPTPPPPPIPPTPPDPEIDHSYDLKFVMRWENSTQTDLDMYGFLDHSVEKKVSYGKKTYGSGDNMMWLDKDYQSHDTDGRLNQPEIITVIGFKTSTLSIQIHNYNQGSLDDKVSLEIYDSSQKLISTHSISAGLLAGDRSYWVCDVDLKTKSVTSKNQRINSVGTFS
ncbi:hypothetical protein IAQ67_28420 (plasmid) [Paenibacillus peoriae]|uniref:Uncharacterized protein n=1 Tax=Paenibacillus peoriae TaxID=59893 RepID=A0A7H0YH86_9BACL|nr:hypothetical protein [Paenibacillus peoriae]QNR70444.1 hypothetical protein IAQ67_28420 [Paenibacillus peoriae]